MRVGGARPAADAPRPGASAGGVDGADLHVSPRYITAIVAGMLMSSVEAGLWLGVGAGLFWGGLLVVLVPLTASVAFLRLALDAFEPNAGPPAEMRLP